MSAAGKLYTGADLYVVDTLYYVDGRYATGCIDDAHVNAWKAYHMRNVRCAATSLTGTTLAYTSAVLKRLRRIRAVLKSGAPADAATWARRIQAVDAATETAIERALVMRFAMHSALITIKPHDTVTTDSLVDHMCAGNRLTHKVENTCARLTAEHGARRAEMDALRQSVLLYQPEQACECGCGYM